MSTQLQVQLWVSVELQAKLPELAMVVIMPYVFIANSRPDFTLFPFPLQKLRFTDTSRQLKEAHNAAILDPELI